MIDPTLECPFCERIRAGEFMRVDDDVVMFEPLDPVTPGHFLYVPRRHVPDAGADPELTGHVFRAAAFYAESMRQTAGLDFNLITSSGANATQTVFHLHVHYVPRREGDGLHLPWTGQAKGPLARLFERTEDVP